MKIRTNGYVAVSYPLKLTVENDKMIDVMYSINPQISRNELVNELIKHGIDYVKQQDDNKAISSAHYRCWLKVD